MNLSTFAIPGAILLVSALACWAIIDARRGKWWLKLILIIIVPTLSILCWRAVGSYLGWATPDMLPEKGLLHWADIREPAKKGDKGVIYVWLVPFGKDAEKSVILGYRSSGREPRAYKMPYTREKHKMLNAAMGMIREGRPVVLKRSPKKGGSLSGQQGDSLTERRADELLIYELPPPDLPKKDGH